MRAASSLPSWIPALILLLALWQPVCSQSLPDTSGGAEIEPIDSISIQQSVPVADTVALTESAVTDTVIVKLHNPMGAMWRSLLFPGWGQLYNRKYLKALILGGTEIGFIYGIIYQNDRYRNARGEGDTVRAAFYKDDRNRLSWWLAGIILYSMADAYADAHLWDFELSPELSLGAVPGMFYIRFDF